MKRVCLFNYDPIDDFHGYKIETFNPLPYFDAKSKWSLSELILWGLNGYNKTRALTAGAVGVDRLYRERDKNYMKMIGDFVDQFRDADIIVMSTYNFIHPEVFYKELKKPIKVLGFIDDPLSTYMRGIPYLWAFDGAFYISPSYIDNLPFGEALSRWSDIPNVWWPLVPYAFDRPPSGEDKFFSEREIDLVYVGNPSASKVERLIQLKAHFGNRFKVHGRWPYKGYSGYIRGLLGKPIYPERVIPLTNKQRTELYWNTKIGFNMHVSDEPFESGNMRTYEAPAHGMMMLCDKAGANLHSNIFKPDVEAIYYDNLNDAIDKVEYYLSHENERLSVAMAGFERYWRDYEWEGNLLKFLNWCSSLKPSK